MTDRTFDAPLLIGKTASRSNWIAYPDRHTLADVATMVDRIGKFGGEATAEALALLGRTVIAYGDIGPMDTENPYGDGRQGETLQPVTLNGEHVGNLARCYNADTGEDLRLVFYDWRPLNPAHDFDDDDDCVCDYRSARAALAAKKAQIAAALGA